MPTAIEKSWSGARSSLGPLPPGSSSIASKRSPSIRSSSDLGDCRHFHAIFLAAFPSSCSVLTLNAGQFAGLATGFEYLLKPCVLRKHPPCSSLTSSLMAHVFKRCALDEFFGNKQDRVAAQAPLSFSIYQFSGKRFHFLHPLSLKFLLFFRFACRLFVSCSLLAAYASHHEWCAFSLRAQDLL